MKKYLALLNDFAHDFFTALWLSCLFVLYYINHKSVLRLDITHTESSLVADLLGDFFWLQTSSMVLIILTGIGRYLHVKGAIKDESYDPQRKVLLIVKHIALGVLFGGGSYVGFIWRG